MASTDIEYPYIDLRAKLADIDRALAQTEQARADAARKRQEVSYAPWQIAVTLLGTGAAIFAAGAAFVKLLGIA